MKKPTHTPIDPEDIEEGAQGALPQQATQTHFQFRGKALAPYSFAHRAALIRFGGGASLAGFEESIYLVYMLLTADPVQIDSIRTPEEVAAFRLKAGKWAEENNVQDFAGWNEVHALARKILAPVEKAEAVQPVSSASGERRTSPNE